MKLRAHTINILTQTVTGDNGKSFYRSGPRLVEFFNELGFDDEYKSGFNFPSRKEYTQSRIKKLIEDNNISAFFDKLLDGYQYIDTSIELSEVVEYLNEYLKYDNYELTNIAGKYKLIDLKPSQVAISQEHLEILSTEFMQEQIEKCDKKIIEGDYDGAITNARSLVEEVLLEIEKEITGKRENYDGKIDKLYNRVKKLLNFDPSQKEFNDSLKQILSGLNSIVLGIGKLRSKSSDSHARQYKPSKHHAELAVNSAKTFTSFTISSYLYQKEKNLVKT